MLQPSARLEAAARLMTARCMHRKGFGGYPVDPPWHETEGAVFTLMGVTLSPSVVEEGYPFNSQPPDPATRFLRALPVRIRLEAVQALGPERPTVALRFPQHEVVARAARKGCVAFGRVKVYGSVREYLLLEYAPQLLHSDLMEQFQEVLRYRRVATAVDAYSTCMNEAGFHAQSPNEARVLAKQRFGTSRSGSTEAERLMATIDWKCQALARPYEIVSDALLDAGAPILREHANQIESLALLRAESLFRADSILAVARP